MQQLSGLDATFLYAELDKSPMHIGPLMIYDPSTAPGGFVRFKDILRTFEERLDRSPVFRRKLATVPLNLDQPYWVEDENFDLEFHVRHIALPKPGDWRQLCILVARLHARPLDRARPLWEAYVIEGLDNVKGFPKGSFAIFLKIHHAAIDGATGTEIVAAIHDLTREPPPPRPADERSTVTAPSLPEMLWRAYLANLKAPLRLARLATRGVPAWRRVHDGVKAKRFHNLPSKAHTRFNNAVTPHRVFGAADFELSVIRRAREGVEGATVNDVILTIVGGALRKYLTLHGELPDLSLVAGAPVNVRGREEQGAGGNVVSMMAVSLRTDVEEFVERLQAVHGEAVSSKAYHQAVGARMMTDLTQSVPAELAALAVRSALASGLMAEMKPIFNTIVTNVPGPQIPLYMGGAEVVRSYGLGPCADGLGLFHAVTSYNGQICVSFQACRTQLPDPAVYEQCLDEVYRELQACFPARPGGKKPAPAKKKAAAKKPAAKKAPAKKATANKATAKKAAARKAAARKAPARGKTPREAAPRKAATKKTATKKSTAAVKSPARKKTSGKSAPRKAAPRKAAPRKAAPRKAAPNKSVRPKHAKQ